MDESLIVDIMAPRLSNILPLIIYERNLPHWQQSNASFFVTFRLADSIPQDVLAKIRYERQKWLKEHDEVNSEKDLIEYNKLFSFRINQLIDAGSGDCILKMRSVSDIVKGTLQHFDEKHYKLGEWVIMPNHVHLIVTPFEPYSLSKITHTWKSYSAHKINKMLHSTATVWQHECYDHIIRNERQLRAIESYILNNPVKSKLKSGFQTRYQSSFCM